MKATAFSLRKVSNPIRPRLKYVVTGPKIQGKRWRRFFATEAEAKSFLQLKKTERENFGVRALEFPEQLRVMAQEADTLLAPFGKTITDAVSFYLPHLKARHRSCAIEVLQTEFISQRKKDGASVRYLQDLRYRLGVFARAFPGKLVSDFTESKVDDWLRGLEVSGQTRNNFRTVLKTTFSFAVHRGYATSNPFARTAKAKVVQKPAGILTPEEAARLLETSDEKILPYFAIGLFAGLRRAELERLDWKEVDLENGHIEVTAAKAKTARRRIVRIEPNLRDWLAPLARLSGAVCPSNLGIHIRAAVKTAGLNEWPQNALRHSYASYHIAHFQDAAALALQMGHTHSQLIFDHYREVVKPAAAARYWKIQPQQISKIIALATSA